MPASLRWFGSPFLTRSLLLPASQTSLGHFRPIRSPVRLPARRPMCKPVLSGSRLSATLTPTARDRPDQSAGSSSRPRENVRLSPRWLSQLRPSRPRPAVWSSATSKVGSGRGAALELPLKRRISSLLLESMRGSISAVKPGRPGATACQMASSGQRMGGVSRGITALTQFFCWFFWGSFGPLCGCWNFYQTY